MAKNKIEESDLLIHWEAWRHVTLYSSEKKLNALPESKRKAIADFYEDLRKAGFYPDRADEGKMKFFKTKAMVSRKPAKVEKIDSSNCKFGDCHKCRVVIYQDSSNCKLRTNEWQKGVDQIMNGWPRPKGEGKRMARELIRYMMNDFMGGVYPPSNPQNMSKEELETELPF